MENNEIFISSAVKGKYFIEDRLKDLIAGGFKCIELSGGCVFQDDILDVLLDFKDRYDLKYRLHNYFPPPIDNFAFNLSANDPEIITKSNRLFKSAVEFCQALNVNEFGIHAGFRQNLVADDLGRIKSSPNLMSVNEATTNFEKNFKPLEQFAAENGVRLYVENNVLGQKNFKNFKAKNPLLLTSMRDLLPGSIFYQKNILFDIAHLKVSCMTLGYDFEEEAEYFMKISDYLHISDNSGDEDTNEGVTTGGLIFRVLKKNSDLLKNKKITLEVYGDIAQTKKTEQIILGLL